MRGRHSYFWILLSRAVRERRSRVFVSVLTVALGMSVVAGFVTLYADIESKMTRELRAYGANFVVRPREEGASLGGEVLAGLVERVPAKQLVGAQPFLYDIVGLGSDRVAVAGIEFDRIAATTPYWQLVGGALPTAEAADACLVGRDLARKLRIEVGETLDLRQELRRHRCTVAALVETGGAEDGQVFLLIQAAQTLCARPGEIDLVLASIVADVDQAAALARKLEARWLDCRAHPIHKLARSEGVILTTTRSIVYVVVALTTLSTFVCLLFSLMATVAERRREIALMKALGATDRGVSLHFLAEIALTGLVGGLVGIVAGFALAHLMERSIFGTAVTFHAWLVLPVLAVALGISVAGAAIPLQKVAAVQPATVLKGD